MYIFFPPFNANDLSPLLVNSPGWPPVNERKQPNLTYVIPVIYRFLKLIPRGILEKSARGDVKTPSWEEENEAISVIFHDIN